MELPEHSLAIYALEKQLNNIHKIRLLTNHTYIKEMLFLSNLELSISPIINDPSLLLPQESDYESIFIDQIEELLGNSSPEAQAFQGILIQKGPPHNKSPWQPRMLHFSPTMTESLLLLQHSSASAPDSMWPFPPLTAQ